MRTNACQGNGRWYEREGMRAGETRGSLWSRTCVLKERREGGTRHGAESGMLGGGGDGGHVAVSREKRERSERAP